jgi:hypothetical protein
MIRVQLSISCIILCWFYYFILLLYYTLDNFVLIYLFSHIFLILWYIPNRYSDCVLFWLNIGIPICLLFLYIKIPLEVKHVSCVGILFWLNIGIPICSAFAYIIFGLVIYLHFFVHMSNYIPPSINDMSHKLESFLFATKKNLVSKQKPVHMQLCLLATKNEFVTHKVEF